MSQLSRIEFAAIEEGENVIVRVVRVTSCLNTVRLFSDLILIPTRARRFCRALDAARARFRISRAHGDVRKKAHVSALQERLTVVKELAVEPRGAA